MNSAAMSSAAMSGTASSPSASQDAAATTAGAAAMTAAGLMLAIEPGGAWAAAAAVPQRLDVRIPLPTVTLANLRYLQTGDVLVSAWPSSEEVPLQVRGVTLGWCGFDVVDGAIGVRLTRLA